MATASPWMTGQHITMVQFVIQIVSLNGLLTDSGASNNVATLVSSTGSLAAGNLVFGVGLLDEVSDFGGTVEMENISPTNRTVANNVFKTVGMAFSVSEIMHRGSNSQQLANIAFNGSSKLARFRYCRAQERNDVYVVITDFNEEISQGRSIGRLSLGPVDAGAATFAVTIGANNDQ